MYMPTHFEETRAEILQALIAEFPLGALINVGPAGLDANHIPFEFDATRGEFGMLTGHIARANPLANLAGGECEALVIFQGASAYVSPNWYPSKAETHRVVPTYNYAVVHAHGQLRLIDDVAWVRALVGRLTRKMEASQPRPWQIEDAPAPFIDTQLAHIVGVELRITRLVGKWKMSQNRSAADRAGVIAGLDASGQESTAAVMRSLEAVKKQHGNKD